MESIKNIIQKNPKLAEAQENSEIIPVEELREAREVLTQEEIMLVLITALREARRIRTAELNTIEYNKKIRAEKAPVQVSWKKYYVWILRKAYKEIKKFKMTRQERDLYRLLAKYFTGDIGFEESGYSLQKGLWIYGGVGCGKTTIMKLFRENPRQNYGVVECIGIADMYKDKEIGVEVIYKYSNVKSICYNDFGTEIETGTSSNFGNKKNVMAEIILNHYERNEEKEFKLLFTTNLGANAVEQYYGPRVRSRLREMCNIISLEGIEDKRK